MDMLHALGILFATDANQKFNLTTIHALSHTSEEAQVRKGERIETSEPKKKKKKHKMEVIDPNQRFLRWHHKHKRLKPRLFEAVLMRYDIEVVTLNTPELRSVVKARIM